MAENSTKVLEKIAHFLCVNWEALDSNGLNGKMPMLYFFFAYAQKFKKQHYTDFSFKVLEEILSDELQKIELPQNKKESSNLSTIEIGWSLQKFVAMGFFETDEINEILAPFDKVAFQEVELLVKKNPTTENINDYVFLTTYLSDRIIALRVENQDFLTPEKYLSAITQKILNRLEALGKVNINSILPLKFVLNGNENLIKIKNFLDKQKKVSISETAMTKNDLETSVFLNICFPEHFKTNLGNTSLFWNNLNTEVTNCMKRVYEKDDRINFTYLLNIIIYGSVLLKNTTVGHHQFLAHSTLNLSQKNNYTPQI